MWPTTLTLHEYRWPFAAARAAIYLAIACVLAITDPAPGSKVDSAPARSGKLFPLLGRDVLVVVRPSFVLIGGRYSHSESDRLELLRWIREHNPASRLVLRVDRACPYSEVGEVLALFSKAGYRTITLETQPLKPLLTRRLESRGLHRDASTLRMPPMDEDGFLRFDGMWH